MKLSSTMLTLLVALGLVVAAAGARGAGLAQAAQAEDDPVSIAWWSHWADQPAKRAVIERIAADYEAEHPGVEIEVTWWDKNPLRDAVRSAMTAGQGAPDITTIDTEQIEWVEAGWMVDIDDALPWENFFPAAKVDGTYPGIDGNYKFNIGSTVDMIFYNPEIFAELGIEVPDNYQFTQDEFVEVVQTCSEGGYAGLANAIGDRPYTARHIIDYALFNLVGPDEYVAYQNGEQPWDTPEARQVLEWSVELRDAGLWPATFSTMTLDEYHVYFHTQRNACMLYIPTWYTGRAFKSVEEGGQSPDFQFGMLRYPEMEGAQANDMVMAGFESGYGVLSATEHPDVAKDILRFASQPRYGALWVAVTDSPSAILFDQAEDWPADDVLRELGAEPGLWNWYWEEFDRVYGDLDVGVVALTGCGDFEEAKVSALNEGLPLDLISVDDAIEMLNNGLCTG